MKANLIVLITALLMGAAVSCKTPKGVTRSELSGRSPEFLIAELSKIQPEFQLLSAKINVQLESQEKNTSFKVNLRIKRDSLIWLSISPALGIEVVRALLTTDSVFVINRLDNNYLATDYEYLTGIANTDIDFHLVQALLTGAALEEFIPSEFHTFPDKDGYMISRMKKRKVRRVKNIFQRIERLERKDRQERIDKLEERKIDRLEENMAATDSSEFVAQSIWMRPEDYRIIRYRFRDFNPDRLLDINYSDFKEVGKDIYPHSVKVHTTGAQPMQLSLVYSRISLDENLSFPFSIPQSYSRHTLD